MIDGILGYSIATLLWMTLASGATAYFLLRLGASPIVALFAVILMFMRPILMPQIAGSLGRARPVGQFLLRICSQSCRRMLAFLIRDLELTLIVAVALAQLAAARPARWAAAGPCDLHRRRDHR